MTRFRVWAPAASHVEVERAGRRYPMEREPGGFWSRSVATTPGDDYGFVLDGAGPFPDPRSAWQPGGVHAASRLVDHSSFSWTDQAWRGAALAAAAFYEMHVGTFTPEGTFASAATKLDHLRQLGVTHVELMPVAQFPGQRGWGYDGVDLFAPHDSYGGPAGLKRFVDACHACGLAVVLDVVYNHLGPSGNYLGKFGPYFTERYATPWGEALNLDGPESDEVRRFLCDNALMWLRDYHLDGLRLDAVHALFDNSANPFLEQLAREVAELGVELRRPLVLVAESDRNDPRLVQPPALGGFGLDAAWSDDFHHALHVVLTGERTGYYADFGSMADVAKALADVFVYDGRYSSYRRRHHGRPATGLPASRFFGYLQNHDQVGNRALGDRLAGRLGPARAKVAAALLLTSGFVPLLFQGEEWGARTPFPYFTDHDDAALARAVSQGRRREFVAFGWAPEAIPDPQARSTFDSAQLDWDEPRREPHAGLLEWHQRLLRLRQSQPALRDGRRDALRLRYDETQGWLAFERGPFSVACNLSNEPRRVPIGRAFHGLVLASETGVRCETGAVMMPQDSVVILQS